MNLRLRYDSLAAMSTELPSNISTPPSVDSLKLRDQASSFLLPPSSTSNTPPTSTTSELQAPIDLSALMLAMFGWQAEPSTIPGLAGCSACFRRLGLWLFKSQPRASSPDAPLPSPPSMARLDVVAEHRDYCPWINASSQGGGQINKQPFTQTSTADLAGWELLLRVVNNTLYNTGPNAAGLSPTEAQRAETSINVPQQGNVDTASLRSEATTAYYMKGDDDTAARDEKDKERWAKLKRLKQVFHVKRGKGKPGDQRKDPTYGKENQKPGSDRRRSVM